MVQRCQLLQPDLTGTRRVLSTVQAAASAQLYRSNASEGRSSTARKQQNTTVSSCAKTGLIKSLDLEAGAACSLLFHLLKLARQFVKLVYDFLFVILED